MKLTTAFILSLFLSIPSPAFERTDLGEMGNQEVLHKFMSYRAAPQVCASAKHNVRRVLVTGFGPFSGSSKNASSEILYHFGQFASAQIPNDVSGNTRELLIDTQEYQVCFLSLTTAWDLAAAIVISEAEAFAPEFILMTGIGGTHLVLEINSFNITTGLVGFDIDGKSLKDNLPVSSYVLSPDQPGVINEQKMTWAPQEIVPLIQPLVKQQGFVTTIENPAISPDNYICNNSRYAVAHAIQNLPLELAGGKIKLTPQFSETPKIGFMHYPSSIPLEETSLEAWTKILEQIIVTATH